MCDILISFLLWACDPNLFPFSILVLALLDTTFQSVDMSDQYKYLIAFDAALRAADKAGIERAIGMYLSYV